nr:MAG TPA: hypothetical protein [Caudoviricetes sp.]
MERFNFIVNVIIIAYIVVKEMDKIKSVLGSMVNGITKAIAIEHDNIKDMHNVIDTHVLSNEDLNSEDFLLATCITVDEYGNEVVVDYDLRGDSAAPLDFSMFGGSKDQHYDINIVKCFAGEKRNTASYYAFENTVEELRRQNKVFKDYVIVSKITLDEIKRTLNKKTVKDVVTNNASSDEEILLKAIHSGIGNTELYKMMLKLHTGGKQVSWI